MWEKNEYIFGYPHGEAPFEAQYRKENEAFERFMQISLGEKNYEKWTAVRQMRIAVSQTVDILL